MVIQKGSMQCRKRCRTVKKRSQKGRWYPNVSHHCRSFFPMLLPKWQVILCYCHYWSIIAYACLNTIIEASSVRSGTSNSPWTRCIRVRAYRIWQVTHTSNTTCVYVIYGALEHHTSCADETCCVLYLVEWSWVHSRGFRTSDPQRIVMCHSTEMSPLVFSDTQVVFGNIVTLRTSK